MKPLAGMAYPNQYFNISWLVNPCLGASRFTYKFLYTAYSAHTQRAKTYAVYVYATKIKKQKNADKGSYVQ